MEKNACLLPEESGMPLRKLLFIMKLSIFLLLITLQISAKNYGQEVINLKAENITIQEIFSRIEKQTKYRFYYSNDDLSLERKFSVNMENTGINEALSKLFHGTLVKWKLVNGNKVVLSESKTPFITVNMYKTVTGKVTDSSGTPIVGVSVSIKGSNKGTITNDAGDYTIEVAQSDMLVFSYVGYVSQTITIGNQVIINIIMQEGGKTNLGEVVVTALGVTKSKKSLNYATQTVETKDLTKARETNVANSLSGRVAGLDVVRSSQGVGSSARIVLRGDRSFARGSEALIIIDGVPGDMGSLNADDIASMNVLKGSSASALYGSDAANGAIIITTKKGVSGKLLHIDINSSLQLEKVVNLRNFQNEYAQGSNGVYLPNSETAWGEKITGQTVPNWSINPADEKTTVLTAHPDNFKDFYSAGTTFTNGFSLSGGGEKIQSFFSYTNISGNGIVDNNRFLRHNFNFRIGGNITDKLSFDTKITYFDQNAKNFFRAGEDFANVNRQILRLPTNIGVDYIENNYQFYNADRELRQNYWNPGSNGGQNPYWVKNNTSNLANLNNIKGLGSLTYRFTPALSLMIRTGLTKNIVNGQDRKFVNTYVTASNGFFSINNSNYTEYNNDFLLSYNKNLADFSIHINAGGNMKGWKQTSLVSSTNSLVIENVFTLNNAAAGTLSSTEGYTKYKKNSLYASADIGYKKFLVLSLTGRNDWSSALPRENRSYFFGSTGLTTILSDMIRLPEVISLLKLRGTVAQTGIDPLPYQTDEYFSIGPGGGLLRSTTFPVENLVPEITTSQEYGADLGFLNNRIGIEFTYYKTNSKNQLVQVQIPPASGYSSKFINAGNVQNTGIEIALNMTPVKTKNFTWTIYGNYAKNKNKVIEVSPNSKEFELGGDYYMIKTRIVEGRPFGEMYSRGTLKDPATGRVLVGDNGLPLITAGQTTYVGNGRPDWTGGLGNQFSYKHFSLSFLITARMGGRIASVTDAVVYGDGFTSQTLPNRSGGLIIDGVKTDGSKNTTAITAEQYWRAVGGRNTPVGEIFTYDASNIRLRELVLSYVLPTGILAKTPIKGASISLTGRNLFFIKNGAKGFDPELVVSTESGSIGIESYCPPFTRSFGINLNLNF